MVIENTKRIEPQVKPSHYFQRNYDTKERFISYWHQVNEIIELEPNSVL